MQCVIVPALHTQIDSTVRNNCGIRTRHLVTESVWPANEVPIAIRQAEKIKRQASEEVTYMLPLDPVVVSNHSVESCCLVFCSLLDCYDKLSLSCGLGRLSAATKARTRFARHSTLQTLPTYYVKNIQKLPTHQSKKPINMAEAAWAKRHALIIAHDERCTQMVRETQTHHATHESNSQKMRSSS